MKRGLFSAILLLLSVAVMLSSCETVAETESTLPYEEDDTSLFGQMQQMYNDGTYKGEIQGILITDACEMTVSDGESGEKTVSGLILYNGSGRYLQYMELTETLPDGTVYEYTCMSLPAGGICRVSEKNGAPFASLEHMSADFNADAAAFFDEAPTDMSDKLLFSGSGSILNVQNISGENIDSDLVVYYNDYADGALICDRTYTVRVEGGLKADEIRQISTEHYSHGSSMIMFVQTVPSEAEQ